MRRIALSDLKELYFRGYSKEEYETLEPGLLRGAKKAFRLQIAFATIFSMIVAGWQVMSQMYWYLFFAPSYHPANKPHMVAGGIIVLFSLLSIKFKPTCIITSLLYLTAVGYVLFYEQGQGFLIVLCVIGVALYVRLFVVHKHLGYIKKRGDVETFGAMMAVAAQAGNVDASLRMMFEAHADTEGDSNKERLRFEKAFDVDVGGDETIEEISIVDILKTDVTEVEEGFSMPSLDIDVADIKEKIDNLTDKFDDFTDKLAGVESEEKSRLDWYSYMPKDE